MEKPDMQDDSTVTPEEQAMYDTVMVNARKVLYGDRDDDSRFKVLLQRMAAGKANLPETIGQIAATVLLNIAGAAEQKQRQIPGDVLFHAGDEIVDDLIEIAASGKLMEQGQAEQVKKGALFAGLKMYGEQELKTATPEKRQAAAAELEAFKAERGGIINEARA